jgi:crotonobetaine/carnitine-CoA ligase
MDLQVAWTPAQQDTVTAVLARSSAAFGDRVFLDFTGDSYSYAEIDKQSTRLARSLQQLGVKKGDTVASILDYNLHAVLAWFAINKVGGVSVPVNTAYKREFLRHQLNDCGATIVIAGSEYARQVAELADGLANIRLLIRRDGALICGIPEVLPLAAFLENSAQPLADPNAPTELAMLIYTAGTTGPSKGCTPGTWGRERVGLRIPKR